MIELSGGCGADVAYIAASTQSTDPMDLAGQLLRDRGRVAIVGMVRVAADWQTYYDKEISVVLSRSYGPGRYDRNYEAKGIDYPVGYVRWTERRNMAEFLRLISKGLVRPKLLEPVQYDFTDASQAYDSLQNGQAGATAMLFRYPAAAASTKRVDLPQSNISASSNGHVGIGLIGAGNFATGTLIPALKATGAVRLRSVCSAGGLSARSAASRHGFEFCASDISELLADKETQAVVIATHHDTHARFTVEALRAGKHVFVEKPLALTAAQLEEIIEAQKLSGRMVMPGFNRRFSSLTKAVQEFFAGRSSPIEVICRVNAGSLKADSWYQDHEEGGWRILSEGCHFIDLIVALCGCEPIEVAASMVQGDIAGRQNDNCAVTLKMADGSLGVLMYVANGDPFYEKERVEVFGQGRAACIENWRRARLSASGKCREVKPSPAGKGHKEEMAEFIRAAQFGGQWPLPFAQAVAVTRATLAVIESLGTGKPVRLHRERDDASVAENLV